MLNHKVAFSYSLTCKSEGGLSNKSLRKIYGAHCGKKLLRIASGLKWKIQKAKDPILANILIFCFFLTLNSANNVKAFTLEDSLSLLQKV